MTAVSATAATAGPLSPSTPARTVAPAALRLPETGSPGMRSPLSTPSSPLRPIRWLRPAACDLQRTGVSRRRRGQASVSVGVMSRPESRSEVRSDTDSYDHGMQSLRSDSPHSHVSEARDRVGTQYANITCPFEIVEVRCPWCLHCVLCADLGCV